MSGEPPPTPGMVGVVFWILVIGIPVCLLIRYGANQERKRQNRQRRH